MKIISIGRSDGCNIHLSNPACSRRHATIKISSFGRMEIVDLSQNGTSVNGVRLRPNTPTPIKRNQRVQFADGEMLDWSLVPNFNKYWIIGSLVAAALILLAIVFCLLRCENDVETDMVIQPPVSEGTVEQHPKGQIDEGKSKDTVSTTDQTDDPLKVKIEPKQIENKKEKQIGTEKSEDNLPSAADLLRGDGRNFRTGVSDKPSKETPKVSPSQKSSKDKQHKPSSPQKEAPKSSSEKGSSSTNIII